MKRWPYEVKHLTRTEIMDAIKCDAWQDLRLSMKGRPSMIKLDMCVTWLEIGCETCGEAKRSIQIDNYINALKRGGQLDVDGNIVR